MIEPRLNSGEGPLGCERTDVELVEDHLLPGASRPPGVGPLKRLRVDDLAGAVHVLGLEAGGRVRHEEPPIDPEAIPVARTAALEDDTGPPVRVALHRERRRPLEAQLDAHRRWRPQREAHPTAGERLSTEWHRVP